MLCQPLLSLCAVCALAPAYLRARFTCPTRTSHWFDLSSSYAMPCVLRAPPDRHPVDSRTLGHARRHMHARVHAPVPLHRLGQAPFLTALDALTVDKLSGLPARMRSCHFETYSGAWLLLHTRVGADTQNG